MIISREQKMKLIARIDAIMFKFTGMKEKLMAELKSDSASEILVMPKGTWVIKNSTYHQYISTNPVTGVVTLIRHNKLSYVDKYEFTAFFVKATRSDVKRHLSYLESKGLPHFNVADITNRVDNPTDQETIETIVNWAKEVGIKVNPQHPSDVNKITLMDFANTNRYPLRPKLTGFDITKCDFYMITVGDDKGSKKRHETYQQAETEAVRLCELTGNEAFIVGVVASVKPIKVTKTITTVVPQINKR